MVTPFKQSLFRSFRKAETKLHELTYLFWECTTRCNLNCLHCGSDCLKEGSHPDMPLEDFLAALATIKEPQKNLVIALTGGEPLLRKDLESCGREIRKRGMRWGMVTNGQLYTPERHQSLLSAGMGSLTISLDGMEETHSWLRNYKSNYERVDRAIDLAAASPRLNFDVVTCVHRRNLKELPYLYAYLVRKQVPAWRLFTITPIGRARENPDLFLSDSEFRELMDFIALQRKGIGKIKEKGRKNGIVKRNGNPMDIKFSCEGFVGDYELKVRDTPFFCRAGINIGSILIDGSISACPNIDRSFSQGNIYRDNFNQIWESRFQPFRDRSWTRKSKCADCRDYRNCLGNGFHNWHGEMDGPLVCHKEKLENP